MDPFSVASAGFGIASGIAGMFGSKKKKKAARKIRVEQQNQAYLQKDSMELNRRREKNQQDATDRSNILSMVDQQRQAQIRKSEMLNAAGNSGAGFMSSGIQSGLAGATSGVSRNVGLLNDMAFFQKIDNDIADRLQRNEELMLDSNLEVSKAQAKLGGGGGTMATISKGLGLASDFSSLFRGSDLFKL